MKKNLLAIILLGGMSVAAQTPRLSLFEEFTGETCPPCAATNPGLNTILASPTNTALVVAIKWQVPIPSAPTATWSLYQTYKSDIDWRYRSTAGGGYGYPSQWTSTTAVTSGINAAPTGLFDGQHQWVFGAASDHPAGVNNAVIASAQSNTAAFSVTMNRAWDATYSSINLTVNIVATANFSAAVSSTANPTSTLVFRTVMVEKQVHFATQSGTNGEKDFDDVAVAAFPNLQTGVAMAPTWTVGQTQTFTLNCPLPSYIRDKAQVAFVGFIQDDVNRKVAQAVRANPTPIDNDAQAVNASIPALSCAAAFVPTITVKNNGATAITALTVAPSIDGVAGANFAWTGNLAAGASTVIALPSMTTATSGGHKFTYNITNVSGGDNNGLNNSNGTTFYLASSYQTSPVAEPFATATYPPTGWGMVNTDGGASWTRNATANGISLTTGTGASKYDFYSNNKTTDSDDLIMPAIDLTGNQTPTLTFDVAYAQYNAENDQLDVEVSGDCGASWTNVYTKSGSGLSTAPAQTSAFTPNASQWRKESVPLTGFNISSVIVKFVASSKYGNNLYIDNVNLAKSNTVSTVGINEVTSISIKADIFPNPSNGTTTLKIETLNNDKASVKVINAIGQVVLVTSSEISVGVNNLTFDVKDLPVGLYNVVIDTKNGSAVRKLTVMK
ncbi:MAG: T9SS type A sorting domain-containing protein [Bacteroidia bacterium]|nr:T9SS type A sorting domain-containing protein [Bacteroidia bacterium]